MNALAAWRSVFWKDFHQVRPALIGSGLILACLQLLALGVQLLGNGSDMALFRDASFMVLLAPSFAALACAGLLIGGERQNRTWNWSSSLPLDWRTALASKVCVWLLSAVVMFASLAAFYALLYAVGIQSGRTSATFNLYFNAEVQFTVVMMLLVPLEGFVIFSLACLLWNDTLLAMVGAAVIVMVGQILINMAVVPWFYGAWAEARIGAPGYLRTTVLATLGWVALASVGLLVAFRWRWTSGQLASISLVPRSSFGRWTSFRQPTAWQTFAERGRQPSELRMMLAHGWRSAIGVQLAIFLMPVISAFTTSAQSGATPSLAVIAAVLLGITTFAGDRTLRRDRFFADRGASWVRFLTGHLLPPLAMMAIIIAVTYWNVSLRASTDLRALWFFALLAAGFAVGVFSSVCISSSVVATTVAGLTLWLGGIVYALAINFWEVWASDINYLLLAVPLTLAAIAAGVLVQVPRNLVLDRPKTLPIFVGVIGGGVLVPLLLLFCFGFLRVPAVPWQGLAVDEVKFLPSVQLPNFDSQLPAAPRNILPYQPALASPTYAQHLTWSPDDYLETRRQIDEAHGLENWFDTWGRALTDLQGKIERRDDYLPASIPLLNTMSRLIESTALVAAMATREKHAQLAVQAWKLNRELLQLSNANTLVASSSLSFRLTVYRLWLSLDDGELAMLQQYAPLAELVPPPAPHDFWARALKERWTMRRLVQRETAFDPNVKPGLTFAYHWIPPLRWQAERRMALTLADELATFDTPGRAADHIDPLDVQDAFSGHDTLYFQLQILRDLQTRLESRLAPWE